MTKSDEELLRDLFEAIEDYLMLLFAGGRPPPPYADRHAARERVIAAALAMDEAAR